MTGVSMMNLTGRTMRSSTKDENSWVWIPSWHDLREHYLRDIGFLACFSMLVGVIVFWIAGVSSLPPIYSALNTKAKLYGAYWIPLLLGGVCFVVSGVLFTLETQAQWWCPAPAALGWHVSVWTLVGAVGFLLYAMFGMAHEMYQANYSSLWGEACLLDML